jgi:hypothetical protein
MELFGILLSIPVAIVVNSLYCLFLERVVMKYPRVRRAYRRISFLVLAMFGLELVVLLTIGPVRARGFFGPGFYTAHIILFLLSTPALANSLVLRERRGEFGQWYVAAAICTVLAFFLVLLPYSVSESLFGIDGEAGPYREVLVNVSPQYSETVQPHH